MTFRRVNRSAISAGALCTIALGSANAFAVYNSEEHKLIADRGASTVDQGTAALPAPTRFESITSTEVLGNYQFAKKLAVGIDSNDPTEYSERTKNVQDNSYWSGFGQRDWNLNIHIPRSSEIRLRHLFVSGWAGADSTFTFGELVSIYGDYRRTVHCESGRCYLTNRDDPQYQIQSSTHAPARTYFEYGDDCFGIDCGWRPAPMSTANYLRAIGSGLVPPFGRLGNTVSNTANLREELDAGWWGDEMLRIANVNDSHFSQTAVAWYIGMHRLALLYVDSARSDDRYWNHALHYEASALHSLTDLFAFGHVVTNRDRTSYGIMSNNGLLSHPAYRWMEHVLSIGGGSRNVDRLSGVLELTAVLPPIVNKSSNRDDVMESYRGKWLNQSKKEHDYHDQFNASGATVLNLKREEYYIYGDAKLRETADTTARVIAETVRASVQSLFDAYTQLSVSSVAEIGKPGSKYFDALMNIPVFIKSHPEHLFDGRWTRYATMVDAITQSVVVPVDGPSCVIPYIDGQERLPATGEACTQFPAPTDHQ